MEANTLRIGNFIFDDNKIISKVTGFSPFDHSTRCDELEGCEILIDLYHNDGTIIKGFQVDSNLTSSIPLSEDWLLKFGAKQYSNSGYWLNYKLPNGFGISQWLSDDQVAGFEIKGCWYYGSDFIEIKSIHHLQNLYFALTNEELTIKN